MKSNLAEPMVLLPPTPTPFCKGVAFVQDARGSTPRQALLPARLVDEKLANQQAYFVRTGEIFDTVREYFTDQIYALVNQGVPLPFIIHTLMVAYYHRQGHSAEFEE